MLHNFLSYIRKWHFPWGTVCSISYPPILRRPSEIGLHLPLWVSQINPLGEKLHAISHLKTWDREQLWVNRSPAQHSYVKITREWLNGVSHQLCYCLQILKNDSFALKPSQRRELCFEKGRSHLLWKAWGLCTKPRVRLHTSSRDP